MLRLPRLSFYTLLFFHHSCFLLFTNDYSLLLIYSMHREAASPPEATVSGTSFGPEAIPQTKIPSTFVRDGCIESTRINPYSSLSTDMILQSSSVCFRGLTPVARITRSTSTSRIS